MLPVASGLVGGLTAFLMAGAALDVVLFAAVCWVVSSTLARRPGLGAVQLNAAQLVRPGVVTVAALAAAVALTGWGEQDLSAGLGVVLASTVVLTLGRIAIQLSAPAVRVALVGDAKSVYETEGEWRERRDLTVVGALALPGHDYGSSTWTDADAEDVRRQVQALDVDTVVVLPGGLLQPTAFDQLCWALETTSTSIAVRTGFDSVARHRMHLTHRGTTGFAEVAPSAAGRRTLLAKGVIDRLAAALLILMIAPALLAIAVAVRLDSPGPAIFRQVRVGRGGRTFTMYKFRTMVRDAEQVRLSLLDADEGNGVLFKIRADPRVTRIGQHLRSTSLDELPQLFNILRGEMSLVGPRPALPGEVERYDTRARRRLAVSPGLTGLWQVSGRSNLDWDESLNLDLRYTDNISLGRDLAICLETVRAVATRRGAY